MHVPMSTQKIISRQFTVTDFTTLKHLARNTIGHPDDFLLNEMTMVIDIFSHLDSKVDETETLISKCVSELNPPMLTIPGIGIDSAAVILAEFGDFSKYEVRLSFFRLPVWNRDIFNPAPQNLPDEW